MGRPTRSGAIATACTEEATPRARRCFNPQVLSHAQLRGPASLHLAPLLVDPLPTNICHCDHYIAREAPDAHMGLARLDRSTEAARSTTLSTQLMASREAQGAAAHLRHAPPSVDSTAHPDASLFISLSLSLRTHARGSEGSPTSEKTRGGTQTSTPSLAQDERDHQESCAPTTQRRKWQTALAMAERDDGAAPRELRGSLTPCQRGTQQQTQTNSPPQLCLTPYLAGVASQVCCVEERPLTCRWWQAEGGWPVQSTEAACTNI